MRISTNMIYDSGVSSINRQLSDLLKLQEQIATQKRINRPSDDPVAAAQVLTVQQQQDQNKQFATNIKYATSALSYEEGQLGSIVEIFGRLKELAAQASDTTLTPNNRSAIAVELRSRFDGLLAIANTKDENGQYLFAGYKGDTRPFSGSVDGGVTYGGDDGRRTIQISPSREIETSDSGAAVFERISNGNGVFSTTYGTGNTGTGVIDAGSVTDPAAWVAPTSGSYTLTFSGGGTTYQLYDGATLLSSGSFTSGQSIPLEDATGLPTVSLGASVSVSGSPADGDTFTITPSTSQSLFTTLANLIHAVESSGTSDADVARYRSDIRVSMGELDNAFENILKMRNSTGARWNEVETVGLINSDLNIQYATTLSSLQDLDATKALTELSKKQIELEAAQKSFVAVSRLSLFNYL